MRSLLTNTKNVQKATFFWNMAAYTGSSFQSMLLMLVIARRGNMADAAMASIAFTAASMLLLVGKYAIRNYQVSDTQEEYTYGDYMHARIITCLWMILASVFYLVFCCLYKAYSADKTICMILIMGYRFLEAAEDALHADFQRQGRLDVAARIWAIRSWSYIGCFAILYGITDEILAAAAGSLILAAVLCMVLNRAVSDLFFRDQSYERERVWEVIRHCFSPAVSTLTLGYIGNATKYTVDAVFSSQEQARFNIVCMPVFVITLLSNYIYNPVVKNMAALWSNRNIIAMKRMIRRQIMILVSFTGIVALCGKWFGVRLLGIIYKVSLEQYETEFVLLMIAGGAIAVFNLLIVVSTVIRRQKMLIYISVVVSMTLLSGNKMILLHQGVRSMCLFYALLLICMALLTLLLNTKYINREGEADERKQD